MLRCCENLGGKAKPVRDRLNERSPFSVSTDVFRLRQSCAAWELGYAERNRSRSPNSTWSGPFSSWPRIWFPRIKRAANRSNPRFGAFSAATSYAKSAAQARIRSSLAESLNGEGLEWRSELNSNCRYRFVNCQATASCQALRHRDEL